MSLNGRSARYLRRTQGIEGGWPLFEGGAANVSASVKAYFALKMIGDEEGADHISGRAEPSLRWEVRRCRTSSRASNWALYGNMPWSAGAYDARRDHASSRSGFPSICPRCPIGPRTVIVPLSGPKQPVSSGDQSPRRLRR